MTGNQDLEPYRRGAVLEPYKGFYIDGTAGLIHPFSRETYPAGSIYRQGRGTSIVEVTRFGLPSFEMESQALAEWFGLELCRMVVDECLT